MVKRRGFLAGAGLAAAAPLGALAAGVTKSTSGLPPRKVVVGTVMQPFWVPYPGLTPRLAQLARIVERMAQESKRKYGRGLDLAILPEAAITGEVGSDALSQSVVWQGPVHDTFGRMAREHGCYVIVPTYLRDSANAKHCSNAAVLVDRKGQAQGIYRKAHLVVSGDGKTMEGGSRAGRELPVFDCDFGKLGIQICYDMEFDRGWRELADQGAELIAWPTQSPQTAQPAARAMEQRCHIVSSTWRHNASVFEPTGKIVAQVKPPGDVLVHEIDLSYSLLPWSSKLQNGKALQKMFGEKIGFRYYEDEDCGIFWSNDAKMPVRQMVQALGVLEMEEELARVRDSYRRAGVLDY
jgi:predicted amidohydrolase